MNTEATETTICRGPSGKRAPRNHYWDGPVVTYVEKGIYVSQCSRCLNPVTLKKGSKSAPRAINQSEQQRIAQIIFSKQFCGGV